VRGDGSAAQGARVARRPWLGSLAQASPLMSAATLNWRTVERTDENRADDRGDLERRKEARHKAMDAIAGWSEARGILRKNFPVRLGAGRDWGWGGRGRPELPFGRTSCKEIIIDRSGRRLCSNSCKKPPAHVSQAS
jgi:hypothetical protein